MIFLNKIKKLQEGQTFVETIIALSLITLLTFSTFVLLYHFLAQLILKKWAAHTSRCIATQEKTLDCIRQTKETLEKRFAFRNVNVETQTRAAQIQTRIQSIALDHTKVYAHFILYPFEYKRGQK